MWDRGPIPGELARFPGYLLARLGEALRRRFGIALKEQGLHPRDFGVIAASLQREMFGHLTRGELATLHRLLRKLAGT